MTDELDNLANGRPPDKFTSMTRITQEVPQTWGTTMQFNEIKSQKRVHKVNEAIGTEDITEIPGIMNPFTGEVMTVRGAIASRILDVRTGKIVASPDGTQVTIDEALRRGLIDPKIAERLFSPCGITEDGRNLTLLEAIQREIYEAEQGFLDPSEKRLKVTHSTTINQAIDDGTVDINTGDYKLESGESITIREAYQKGYLLQQREVKIKTGAVCLYDAINQGLIDEKTGWIVDRNSGNKYQIDAAVKTNVIDGDVREIVDPKSDNKVTVIQALEKGIINPKLGKYALAHEKLPFSEAKRRQYIVKPMTLKDVVDANLIDEDGKIASPRHQSKLTVLEAISRGVLDSETVKSILHSSTGEYLTLSDAIAQGIILLDSQFKDALTGEVMSIPEAVHRGYIISVVKKSIFDVDGFQPPDKSGYISFNAAHAKGYISQKSAGSLVTNLKSGKLIPFAEGVTSGEVMPEVYEMLSRKVGVFENGEELTVLEAVFRGYIDPSNGNFIDIRKNKVVPLNDAIAENLITAEGAALLNSLLTISVKTHTTSKVVQRYVTVTIPGETVPYSKMTYTEALQKGLIDNENQTFADPDSKQTIPITQALNEGKILPDTESVGTGSKEPSTVTIKVIQLQPELMEVDGNVPTRAITATSDLPTLYTETKIIEKSDPKTATTDFITSEKQAALEKQVYELPVDGWSLADAISQELFDPVTGLFIIPGTDRLVSFEECIHLKIINPSSALTIDPSNKRKISIAKALERKILDATGHYASENKKLNMKEAIEKGLILLENKMEIEPSSQRLLQVTKEVGKPAKVEVSNVLDKNPPTYTEVLPKESSVDLEPVQVENGAIYDPCSTLVIYPDSNKSENLLKAVEDKKLSADSVKVKHPITGEVISLNEAIQRNIIDKDTGEYTDKTGHKISLQDAAKYGILTVIGAPLLATQRLVQFVHKVIDPETNEPLALETALEKGVIEEDTYNKLKSQAFIDDEKAENTPKTELISSLIKHPEKTETVKLLDSTTIDLDESTRPSAGERARARITVEPKYTVVIGRGRSVSPDREPKKVVLQKLRKKIVKPKDAAEKGLIDQTAAQILDASTFVGDETLQDALNTKRVDGDKGKIVDPQRGDLLTINEAIERGILDPSGTNEILVPLNRSLSIPELYEQGLIDPNSAKIVHPETGLPLSMREAVVCEILDPLSKVVTPSGEKVTLGEALQSGAVDDSKAMVQTRDGVVDLATAIKTNIFDKESSVSQELPPAGMTFEVALKRGLIDPERKEVIHPITKERIPLKDAIQNNFIMTLPFPVAENSVSIEEALDSNLINFDSALFVSPKTGEAIPVSAAIETGQLVLKPPTEGEIAHSVTTASESVTTVHTVTTTTIELLNGYILLNANEVQNVATGEVMSVPLARKRGVILDVDETKNVTALTFTEALSKGLVDIKGGLYTDPDSGKQMLIGDAIKEGVLVAAPYPSEAVVTDAATTKTKELNMAEAFETIYDESSGKFLNPDAPNKQLTFAEAVEKEIIDPNSIVYDVNAQTPITIEQAMQKGLIDPKTGKVKDEKSGTSINFKEAAKKGLIAVIGGLAAPVALPVLAGAAAVKAVKGLKDKHKQEPKKEIVTFQEIAPKSKVISYEQIEKVDDVTFEKLSVYDAISQNKIAPRVCRIMRNKKELPYTVQDALSVEEIHPQDVIEIINKNLVNLVSQKPKYLRISKEITPQKLQELGYYDIQMGSFIDSETSEAVTFEDFAYTVGVFDPDSILVRDITKKGQVYVSLHEAVRRPLINAHSGYMVDSKTGKRVPFFEAVKIKWIIDAADRPKPKTKPLTLEQIVGSNQLNTKNFEVTVPETNEVLPLTEAVDRNVVSAKSVTIRDPKNLTLIPYYDAVEQNVVDVQKGVVVNTATQNVIEFPDAFYKGYILAVPRPISLQAVIHKGMYDPETCKISDPLTKQLLPLGEAVDRKIIDDQISEVKDTKADIFITLSNALVTNIVDPESGKLLNTLSGELVPLNVALDQNLIQTKPLILSLLQAILLNYYSPSNGLILNPTTGDEISLRKAIEYKLIDPATTKIKDDKRHKIVEINEAIESNLVDPEKGVLTLPPLTLDEAYAKGYIFSTVLPWSLQQAIVQKAYDPKTGQVTINNDSRTVSDAISENMINSEVLTIKDPSSGEIITLKHAIEAKLVDAVKGQVVDPLTQTEVNLYDAYDRGIIVPYQSQITLSEAVFKGFYDPNTGHFINPKNKEKMRTEKAINLGIVDPSSTLVTIDEEVITFDKAVDKGRIDTKSSQVVVDQSKIDFAEAFERGYLTEVPTPLYLSEAIAKGVFDPESQLFLEPQTGNYLTLIEAIEANLIDPGSVHVKDTRTGVWRKLTLIEAIDSNYVDRNTGRVKDYSKGESYEVSLIEAFDLGILVDNKVAVSLQRAIHQGLYDEKSGKIIDPNTERKITLHEAVRKFIINPLLPCYFSKKQNCLINLSDTCRLGIIDQRNGTFKEPYSEAVLPLTEALNLGLIVDIETANFGLYEALEMGLFDAVENVFSHPATGRKYNLKGSCANELVNPMYSLVKDIKLNKYVQLPEAVNRQLINDVHNVYNLPNGKTIDLLEAKQKGLIVTVRRLLTLEEAIKNHLYRPESGKFVDPVNGEYYDLVQALNNGFIDSTTTAFKDQTNNAIKSLNTAIIDGNVDAEKGRVLDPKTKKTYNFDVAFEKGLLITLDKPLIEEIVSKTIQPVSKSRPIHECSLEEAIKFELINPDDAVIKDLQTGRFKTVTKAVESQVLDPSKIVVFEPSVGKVQSQLIIYDQNIPIYRKEPLSFEQALESQHLNILTGQFTDPQSSEVLTIKDSISLGFIDPDSALVKDASKRKLVKLPEAFRKGLADAEKGSILDISTSKLYSLSDAIDSGLLSTPRHGFTLIESLIYGLYNPTTGGFNDPFLTTSIIDRKRLTLNDAIAGNLVDPSSTVIKDPENGSILSVLAAIDGKLVDPVGGTLHDKNENKDIDLVKALERGLILPAEQRVSVFCYAFCLFVSQYNLLPLQ